MKLDETAVEAAAREAFWSDDVGGHVRGHWTWETIPEQGRQEYRRLVTATITAYLTALTEGRS